MFRTPFSRVAGSRPVSLVAIAAALAVIPQVAFAQDGAEAEADFGDPIIVTAQKRSELAKDVPITVSALRGRDLFTIGVDEFDEVAAFIPGLIVQEQSVNNPGFVIRGITSDSGSAQIAPRVTIYYNGVDVSRSRGSYFDLFDIEQIEVVKGPQATLFGTASTIGAISVTTARPVARTEASASVTIGNFNARQLNLMVNNGNDMVAARLAGVFKQRDGFIENLAGRPGTISQRIVGVEQDNLNGFEQYGIRGSVRVFPAPDATIDLVLSYEKQNNPGTAFVSGTIPNSQGSTSPFGPAELGGSPFSNTALGASNLSIEREVVDANLTVEFPINDALTFTSITGFRQFDSLEVFDADGSALFYLEFAEDARGDQFSHESRIAFNSDRFRGFAGVNYFREDGTQAVPFSTDEGTFIACAPFAAFNPLRNIVAGGLGVPLDQVCGGPNVLNNASAASTILTTVLPGATRAIVPYDSVFTNGGIQSSFSAFVDGTLVLGDLELTAGLRYITENRESTYFARQPGSVIFASAGFPGVTLLGAADTAGQTFSARDSFDAWLPRFNALYRLNEDVNVYATISKGRRSPVLNLTAAASPTGPRPNLTLVEEEQVWNYEGGIKGASGGFSGSVGVFYQNYSNFQTSLVNTQGMIVPVNAGRANNFGVEVEAAYAPNRNIRIFGNYAYIDAKIGTPANAGNTQFVGSRFRLQPEHTASGGIDVSLPLGNGGVELFVTPTATYQSNIFFEIPNNPLIAEDAYALVNLRAGVRFGDGRYQVTGFARNLLDRRYLIDAGNTGFIFATPTFIAGEPRLYGIEISARY